jgi:hypothetical protein
MILTGIGIAGSQCTPVSYTCIVQCYTANTTWYCWPGAACAEVITIGAGGAGAAGGSTPTPGPNKASTGGGGGGGGGVSICTVSAGTFGKCQTLVVGSGNSCFGALVTATKGSDGCSAISNTTAFAPEVPTGSAPGGVGNYANGGAGGGSCTAAGDVSAFSGGSCATAPGGGGGGGQTYVTNTATYYGGFAGAGGSSATLCGITLGSGGRGGQGLYCIPPSSVTPNCSPTSGTSYGGGGGGGAAGARSGAQSGAAGAPGIIKVTQFVIPVTPVLDTYSSALEAYSLRLLRTAYAGNAIRVRRSSDNAEQNIGFVNGYLDTSSLLTFVGAGNGFITTWYDQSGNGRNVTQTTAGNQPRIVTSGVLLTSNGKATISFGTTEDWWLNMNGLGFQSTISLFATWTITDGPTNGGVYGPSTTNVGQGLEIIQAGPTNQTLVRINGTQRITGATTASRLWTSATQTISAILGNSTSVAGYKNNAAVTMANSSAMPTLNSSEPFSLGRYYDVTSYNMYGNVQEWILWTSNQTSNVSGINSNINSYYGAY